MLCGSHRAATAAVWNRVIQAAANEGQGIWSVVAVTAASTDFVYHQALAGDAKAERVMHAMVTLLSALESRRRPSPAAPFCLTCGARFWHQHIPAAVVFLSAAVDIPMRLLVSAVCADCWAACGSDANRRAAILDGLRCHYGMDGLRVLPPIVASGHA